MAVNKYKKIEVSVNLDNPQHFKLWEWINQQTTNKSEYARNVLLQHMKDVHVFAGIGHVKETKIEKTDTEGWLL